MQKLVKLFAFILATMGGIIACLGVIFIGFSFTDIYGDAAPGSTFPDWLSLGIALGGIVIGLGLFWISKLIRRSLRS